MTPERIRADGHDRMLLVIMATPQPLPEHVDRPRWPVHVTVVGNFWIQTAAVDEITALIERAAQSIPAFDITFGPSDSFGTEKDVPVLLAPHPSLQVLHESLATPLADLPGFEPVEPQFWHAEYRPHASLGPAVRVHESDTLPLKVLTLVELDQRTARPVCTARFRDADAA